MTTAKTGKRFVVLSNGAKLRIHGVRDGKYIVSRCDVDKWYADSTWRTERTWDGDVNGSLFAMRMEGK